MEVQIIGKPETDLDMKNKIYYEVTLTDEDLKMLIENGELIYPHSDLTEEMRTQFIFKTHPYTSNKKFQLFPDGPSGNALYTEIACDYKGLKRFKNEIKSLGIISIKDYALTFGKDATLILGYVDIKFA